MLARAESSPDPDQPLDELAEVRQRRAEMKARQLECLKDRAELLKRCESDEQFQAYVYKQCASDIFFFIYFFTWTYDPREEGDEQYIPMVLFEYQVDLIIWICEQIDATVGSIEKRNLLIEKSRDMGVTWILIIVALWYWLFKNSNILIGSRKEEEVDRKGDMDTPFEKLRFLIKRMPVYLLPRGFVFDRDTGERLIKSPQGGQQIVGEASTADFGRGGRYTFIIKDEFQSWPYAEGAYQSTAQSTNCRILNGTPDGPYNLHARLAMGKTEEKVDKRRIHWSEHPIKGAGLKRREDGTLTSPWYEQQLKSMSPEAVAAELDIKYDTSDKALIFTDCTTRHLIPGLKPVPDKRLVLAWDPGLTFYILFGQIDQYNRVLCLKELCVENARIHDIAQEILRIKNDCFRDYEWEHCGDPAGSTRGNSAQEDAEYETLGEYDIWVDYHFMQEVPTGQRIKRRHTAIHNKLREYCPARDTMSLLINSDKDGCPILAEALTEGYRWKVDKRTKKILEIVDEKHPSEDAVDCLGYLILYKLGLNLSSHLAAKPVTVARNTVSWSGKRGLKRRHA